MRASLQSRYMSYWPSLGSKAFETKPKRNKTSQKKQKTKSSYLDRTSLVNKGFIIWPLGRFFFRDTVGRPEWARKCHLTRLGSQSQCTIWFILPAQGGIHQIRQCSVWVKLGKITTITMCSKHYPLTKLLPTRAPWKMFLQFEIKVSKKDGENALSAEYHSCTLMRHSTTLWCPFSEAKWSAENPSSLTVFSKSGNFCTINDVALYEKRTNPCRGLRSIPDYPYTYPYFLNKSN